MAKNDLSIFRNDFDLFDPFFEDDFFRGTKRPHQDFLKCDVIENDKDYELIMDVPGLKKENVHIDLEDGNLTISVETVTENDEEKKNYVRKERRAFQSERSFYVGNVKEADIKAKLENGELHITIPKEEEEVVNKKTIEIE